MEHPRIAPLRSQVCSLPLDEHSRAVLLKSLEYFGDTLFPRPIVARHKRRNDFQVLHQVALSGMMERALQEKFGV